MGKVAKLTRNRLLQLIFILFLISFSPGFVVYAEDAVPTPEATPATVVEQSPVVEAAPVVEPAPEPTPEVVAEPTPVAVPEVVPVPEAVPQPVVEPTPVPEITPPVVEPVPESEAVIDPVDQEIFDETFTNPVTPDPTTTDPIPAPVDPDELFSEPPKEDIPAAPEPGSLSKEEIKKLDDVFTNTGIKEEIIKAPEKVELVAPPKEKITPLHSCAFDDFSIEMSSNEKKSKPVLLKKSGPNKKFALKVGDLPEGIEINFSTGDKDFTAGESGSQALAQEFSDLENKVANKELIFNESVLEEKDPLAKSKEIETKIDKSDIIVEEISITSSADSQKGSFNIPIIYAESDEVIGEQNFGSASTIEATCQFNLIVK